MQKTMVVAARAAAQNTLVLLTGESGTGKNWLARWIHSRSPRRDGPFFTINCAALASTLAESELFGHEPGAFTGARGRKRGLLELATGGTLVLDEIGDMDSGLQSKLLTFLDTKSFMRVGGEQSVRVETRMFACTNQNLEDAVLAGRFRQDLYYRLNVLPIRVPPLRERTADLERLVAELLDSLAHEMGKTQSPRLTAAALDRLKSYHWPGNIRELRNVLERAIILATDDMIDTWALMLQQAPVEPVERQLSGLSRMTLHEATATVARELIRQALTECKTKKEAAMRLGLTRHALAHQIRALGIDG
jgi:transcriptional regulator with PAS, ATPase and Fis domain